MAVELRRQHPGSESVWVDYVNCRRECERAWITYRLPALRTGPALL
jgi:hypothetical protein